MTSLPRSNTDSVAKSSAAPLTMASLPRSNTDQTAKPSSTGPVSKGSKVETVTAERDSEAHAADLQDTDMPAFTRTHSYYVACTPDDSGQVEYEYILASDVRRQINQAHSEVCQDSACPMDHIILSKEPKDARDRKGFPFGLAVYYRARTSTDTATSKCA
ncbi:hypothetical protein ACRE_072150 [Hapsidospora chrysogenum ATCC 11550]|uniref:Uncharacterized protein n=1 Tax=Hapsidospora chrysogenum (strain ATCC 11550 / CBS 779.69 / DSM 880 / IAM 14645 / JCM 23072 / IMI 49137) TaxID=857340 RepID=A0A086SYA2_HAPC1|nr:hypothetical protein ACRE_072150 [Hapsidospora chrysogenum ATCC 11550]